MMQVLKEGGWCSLIFRDGQTVTKKFKPEHLSLKKSEAEFYRKAAGIPGIPPLIEEGEDYIKIPYYPKSFAQFNTLPPKEKTEILNRVANMAYDFFMRGFCHGDIFEENLVFDDHWNPFLIDSMSMPYPKDVPFSECYDLNGKRPLHPYHQAKERKPCLDLFRNKFSDFHPFDQACKRLSERIIKHAGSETYDDMAGKQAYSSYDFPGIFVLPGWRSTKDRFDQFISPTDQKKMLGQKSILDLGCNAGAVSLRAAYLGAKNVVGIDLNQERVNAGNEAAKFCGMSQTVILRPGNITDISVIRAHGSNFDALFCLAVSGRIGNEEAFLNNVSKMIKETIYFESNHAPDGYAKYIAIFNRLGFKTVKYNGSTSGFPVRHSITAKR